MKISREIKTAILVLSGIALFIYLFSYLKGEDLFTTTHTYYTEFDYNALSASSPVTVKGNSIGKIEEIKYDFDSGKTRVAFSVNPKFKFSKNSKIRLYQIGLIGGNALAIVDANDGVIAQPGDFIISEIKKGLMSTLESDLPNVTAGLDGTLRSADTLVNSLNDLVIDETDLGLKSTIAELNSTLKSFKSLSNSIQKVVIKNDQKIASILNNFDKTSKNLNDLSAELKGAGLSNTITNLNNTLVIMQKLLASIDNGKGTIGKLLKDDNLYKNLEGASKEMELLLLDIKLHPARYRRILSKKEIPYQAPTEDQKN
ncbi:MlaD family protein [uncultured Winogradskyella sp.]|uniref:MlaD family protein n=1 Tax=uncultured Winogradskyella sp. TaxID=395353 RepID=UPI0030D954AD